MKLFRTELEKLRDKQESLLDKAKYHFDKRREWALLAYDLDPMCEPLRWGQRQNQANWHDIWYRETQEKLDRVRDRISEIEN